MAQASPVRTVIAADFDNDGVLEVFYNNIVYERGSSPETWKNRLFRVSPTRSGSVSISKLDVGDAVEPYGRGTGGKSDRELFVKCELCRSHCCSMFEYACVCVCVCVRVFVCMRACNQLFLLC